MAFSSPSFLILETIQTEFHEKLLTRSLTWDKGYMLAPTEPGLGIELDVETILNHPYSGGGRLHLEMCNIPLDSNNQKKITEL